MSEGRAIVALDPDAIYARQRDLGLFIPGSATVVGLGGTGSWVAMQLALLGVQTLTLIDADTVEIHNLNRLPVPPEAIGKSKVVAVAEEITRLRPHVMVIPMQMMWQGDEEMLDGEVFDCTDNNRTQRKLYEAVGSQERYHRSGCGDNQVTATRRLPGWGDDDGDGYGAQGIPIWVGPAVLAATRAVGAMARGWPEVSGDIMHIDKEE